MTRTILFLLTLTAFSLISVWFVENDGSVVVEWMDYRVQTSVAFAILFVLIAIVACTLLLQLILWIKSAPKRYRKNMKDRKQTKGLTALTQGFAAIAAGDSKQAHTLSRKATNNLDNMPLTKLLAAQTAQLEGNRELAKQHYNSMLENKETEIIAIKGLLIEAKQDNDLPKALFLAEKAYSLRPDTNWVMLILFDLYKKLKKWDKAEEVGRKALKLKFMPEDIATRALGIIAFAKYEEQLKFQGHANEILIRQAYKLVPDFVPVTTAYATLLIKNGDTRKAAKILESLWRENPHPDIGSAYMAIYADETPEKRIDKAQRLLNIRPGNQEGYIVMANTALATGYLEMARENLKAALSYSETKAVCNLMAELTSMEEAGHKVVHSWRERALSLQNNSVWKCHSCGARDNKWHVLCENCSSFDSMEWQDKKNDIGIIDPAGKEIGLLTG